MNAKILITGIPGTGKTTLGEHLSRHHGFTHVDLEEEHRADKLVRDVDGFVQRLEATHKKLVFTWGFPPSLKTIEVVLRLKELGYRLIWLDGNRDAARSTFHRRGDVSESLFYRQIQNIEDYGVIEKIGATVVNVFDDTGHLVPVEATAEIVLGE